MSTPSPTSYRLTAQDANGAVTWETELDGAAMECQPFVTDLDGDGIAEVLAGQSVVDGATGATEALLDISASREAHAIAGDLDGDGIEEIVAATYVGGDVTIHAPDGSRTARCFFGGGAWNWVSLAIGDLDADDDGEIVAAGNNFVVVCDADGTVLAKTDIGGEQPPMVGIGELDGDDEAEILVADYWGIVALDHDLTPRWTYTLEGPWGWYPFALADLNGDGLHEILVHIADELVVVDSAGLEIASVGPFTAEQGTAWQSQPIVADIDADGLAEIVLGHLGGDGGPRGCAHGVRSRGQYHGVERRGLPLKGQLSARRPPHPRPTRGPPRAWPGRLQSAGVVGPGEPLGGYAPAEKEADHRADGAEPVRNGLPSHRAPSDWTDPGLR